MDKIIEIRQLRLDLGGRPVLRDIRLTLGKGEMVALLGPNGAGKTSLLRCLAGLLEPDEGHVEMAGKPLVKLSRNERARRLAYLEQDADCHWPMTVEDVVALGRLPYRIPSRLGLSSLNTACHAHIDRTIEQTDLACLRHRRVDSLSGGERRRVMLARCLATRADILLADEPVAGLDPAHQLQMMELLTAKAAEGMAVVVVLHDLALAARFCRRLILLQQGCVVADGPQEEVLTPELLAGTYGIRMHIDRINGLPVILPISVR